MSEQVASGRWPYVWLGHVPIVAKTQVRSSTPVYECVTCAAYVSADQRAAHTAWHRQQATDPTPCGICGAVIGEGLMTLHIGSQHPSPSAAHRENAGPEGGGS